MKRFRFRLETVLRVRRVQEDQARTRLLAANRDVALATARVGVRQDRYATMTRPSGPQPHAVVESLLFDLDAAAGAIAWAAGERTTAVEDAQAALHAWAQAEQRVRALERLRDRARDEHATQVRRDEDRLADELAITRFRIDGAAA